MATVINYKHVDCDRNTAITKISSVCQELGIKCTPGIKGEGIWVDLDLDLDRPYLVKYRADRTAFINLCKEVNVKVSDVQD